MSRQATIDTPFPDIYLQTLSGEALVLGRPPEGKWRMLVVYRGLHCPICKKYLSQINEMKADFDEMNVQVVAVSTDPEEKAKTFAAELDLDFEVAYGLGIDQARNLGLYISTPMDRTETDKPFTEPALFFLRPDGGLHFVEISSAPFCRPDLEMIKKGIGVIQEKDYPPRGTG
ncbi:peroxiredoxin-like family protein [Halomonas rhizosphaerae]|uniref:Peroxiredoxin-like family protein n=1 Tax=Halomonas rhizosphaerae TaxID=3043296 RepID=A0ABT6V1A0_9GAMM|nr:peroxiredoxin-like family protein [Halomonas rhizosphaerae]MDI5891701.1 peroxiredoxin-like family protein [Halomonas rhizosphaerae]